jgi:hypothetical protein
MKVCYRHCFEDHLSIARLAGGGIVVVFNLTHVGKEGQVYFYFNGNHFIQEVIFNKCMTHQLSPLLFLLFLDS